MSEPPGLLARRAIHQYRRRDAIAHTALRHHLRAACARRDGWAERVDAELVMSRSAAGYLRVRSFKEMTEDGKPSFRDLHLPGPSEVMAEAALLRACSAAGGPFAVPANVFSYPLAAGDDARGVFAPYWEGYQRRQADIREACRRGGDVRVVYADVRRFYSSVTLGVAGDAWRGACNAARLGSRWTELGEKMLADQAQAVGNDGRLLTGPMFSHLVGNLVLRGLDEAMLADAPGRYFRYVDDVALVASPTEAPELERRVADRLAGLGLEQRHDKRIEASADDWRRAEQEFINPLPPPVPWAIWLARIKQAMLFHPERRDALASTFAANGIRLRPLDYGPVVQGRSYLGRMWELASERWFRRTVRQQTTTEALVLAALDLRDRFAGEFRELLPRYAASDGFRRKQCRSRLNFVVGRLIYLASPARLGDLAAALGEHVEYAAPAAVLRATGTRDVTELLRFGVAAAQTAARPLLAGGVAVTCRTPPAGWDEPAVAALAVLHLEGLRVDHVQSPRREPLLRLADWRGDSAELFNSPDPFVREFACLHGLDDPDANRRANDEAFDRDDRLALHLGELMGTSS